jgi:nucleoside-diphosphate kinase
MRERSLVLVKPDGVQRRLIGEVISRVERKGLKIVGLKMMVMDENLVNKHYQEHVNKPFFPKLKSYVMSGPVVAMVVEGKNAVSVMRLLIGSTDPSQAAPGTIRGDLALDIGRNVVHASATVEDAEREVKLFFSEQELCEWDDSVKQWLLE